MHFAPTYAREFGALGINDPFPLPLMDQGSFKLGEGTHHG